MTKKLLLLSTAAMTAVLISATPARADQSAQIDALLQRITQMEQEIKSLRAEQQVLKQQTVETQKTQQITARQQDEQAKVIEKTLAEISPAAGEVRAADGYSVSLGKKGLEISNAAKTRTMRIGGYLQAENQTFFNGDPSTNSFRIASARLEIDGKVDDFYYGYAAETELLKDAYVGYHPNDAFDVRMGLFKAPVSLEFLRSSPDMTFTTLGLVTQLAPPRDTGIMFSGRALDNALLWQAGVFNGNFDNEENRGDFEDGKTFAGRLFVEPQEGKGFGVAGTVGDINSDATDGVGYPAYNMPYGARVFEYIDGDVAGDGLVYSVMPQGYFYHGPFGFLAEAGVFSQELTNVSTGVSLTPRHTAYGAEASWILTGEDATYGAVSPAQPFDPAAGQWGAWQVAARYGRLNIDNDVFPGFANPADVVGSITNWGLALNGYLNDNVRVQATYEQNSFGGRTTGNNAGRDVTSLVTTRATVRF